MGISNTVKCFKICLYRYISNDHNFLTVPDRTKNVGSRYRLWGSPNLLRISKMFCYQRFKSYDKKAKMSKLLENKADITTFEIPIKL